MKLGFGYFKTHWPAASNFIGRAALCVSAGLLLALAVLYPLTFEYGRSVMVQWQRFNAHGGTYFSIQIRMGRGLLRVSYMENYITASDVTAAATRPRRPLLQYIPPDERVPEMPAIFMPEFDPDYIEHRDRPSIFYRMGFAYAHSRWPGVMESRGVVMPAWIVALVLAIPPVRFLWSLPRRLRARRARLQGACSNCLYDLRAHRPGDKCPECGTAITKPV